MLDPFWLSLLIKMVTSAAIVMVASLIVERTGSFVGAMIAALPISAGPAYAFIAWDHDPAFVAQSALVSLAANAAIAPFLTLYAAMAQRRSLLVSLGTSLILWLLCGGLIWQVDWTLGSALAANAASFAACFFIARRYSAEAGAKVARRGLWDLPLRAAAVMGVIAAVVVGGKLFGPTASGIAALFPVVWTSMALVLHPRMGGKTAAAVLANGLLGMIGFGIALTALHLAVVPLGSAFALSLGLCICLVWNAGLTVLRRYARPTMPLPLP